MAPPRPGTMLQNCSNCKMTLGSREATVAAGQGGRCRRCQEAFKNDQYCPMCHAVWMDEDGPPMACCDGCNLWVHEYCDQAAATLVNGPSPDEHPYCCPLCKLDAKTEPGRYKAAVAAAAAAAKSGPDSRKPGAAADVQSASPLTLFLDDVQQYPELANGKPPHLAWRDIDLGNRMAYLRRFHEKQVAYAEALYGPAFLAGDAEAKRQALGEGPGAMSALRVIPGQNPLAQFQQEIPVECKAIHGTFFLGNQTVRCEAVCCAGRAPEDRTFSATKWEQHAGQMNSKKWKASIKIRQGGVPEAKSASMCIGRWLDKVGAAPYIATRKGASGKAPPPIRYTADGRIAGRRGRPPNPFKVREVVDPVLKAKPWLAVTYGPRKGYKPIKAKYAGDRCCACDSDVDYDTDCLLTCGQCGIAVHQSCYGVPNMPPKGEIWVCRVCEEFGGPARGRYEAQCCLCPVEGGARKPTTIEGLWCHATCLQWVPEVSVKDVVNMEPVRNIEGIQRERWDMKCSLCKQTMGVKIQCHCCFTAFHPLCARMAGLRMEVQEDPDDPLCSIKLVAFCARHCRPDMERTGIRPLERDGNGSSDDDVSDDEGFEDPAQPYKQPRCMPLPELESCARTTDVTRDWERNQHGTGTGATSNWGFWMPAPPQYLGSTGTADAVRTAAAAGAALARREAQRAGAQGKAGKQVPGAKKGPADPGPLKELPEGMPEELRIVCNGKSGVMHMRTQKVQYNGQELTASRFEHLSGRGDAKKWKISICVELDDGEAGETMQEFFERFEWDRATMIEYAQNWQMKEEWNTHVACEVREIMDGILDRMGLSDDPGKPQWGEPAPGNEAPPAEQQQGGGAAADEPARAADGAAAPRPPTPLLCQEEANVAELLARSRSPEHAAHISDAAARLVAEHAAQQLAEAGAALGAAAARPPSAAPAEGDAPAAAAAADAAARQVQAAGIGGANGDARGGAEAARTSPVKREDDGPAAKGSPSHSGSLQELVGALEQIVDERQPGAAGRTKRRRSAANSPAHAQSEPPHRPSSAFQRPPSRLGQPNPPPSAAGAIAVAGNGGGSALQNGNATTVPGHLNPEVLPGVEGILRTATPGGAPEFLRAATPAGFLEGLLTGRASPGFSELMGMRDTPGLSDVDISALLRNTPGLPDSLEGGHLHGSHGHLLGLRSATPMSGLGTLGGPSAPSALTDAAMLAANPNAAVRCTGQLYIHEAGVWQAISVASYDATTGRHRVSVLGELKSPSIPLQFDEDLPGALHQGRLVLQPQAVARPPEPAATAERARKLYGPEVVGRKVRIWWDGDACYYPASIIGFNGGTGQHRLLYEDGEIIDEVLNEHRLDWVTKDAPRTVRVLCGGVRGVMDVARSVIAIPAQGNREVSPTEFEKLAGKESSKKWKATIRVERADGSTGETIGDWMVNHGLDVPKTRPVAPATTKSSKKSNRQSKGRGGGPGRHKEGCLCIICKQARNSGKPWSGLGEEEERRAAEEAARAQAAQEEQDAVERGMRWLKDKGPRERYGKRAFVRATGMHVGGARPHAWADVNTIAVASYSPEEWKERREQKSRQKLEEEEAAKRQADQEAKARAAAAEAARAAQQAAGTALGGMGFALAGVSVPVLGADGKTYHVPLGAAVPTMGPDQGAGEGKEAKDGAGSPEKGEPMDVDKPTVGAGVSGTPAAAVRPLASAAAVLAAAKSSPGAAAAVSAKSSPAALAAAGTAPEAGVAQAEGADGGAAAAAAEASKPDAQLPPPAGRGPGAANIKSMEQRLAECHDVEQDRITFGKSGIHGWGLLAKVNMSQDTMITEYRGDCIRLSIANQREEAYRSAGKDCYLFAANEECVIDATTEGHMARFINHSCAPSLYAKVVDADGTPHLVFFARTDVKAGQELTFNYRFSEEETEKKVPCDCGAPNCIGFLN
ncbi:unnamed protein product [Pedinophyceae sp. YPF-701]|nr:unnamed protein product [Pedinophyceae sp. YPF-701]